jgi:peptidoglycan/LPS O-acetylase OafA/YrhL
MSSYGRLNLALIFGLPALAAVTSMIQFGVRGDTIVFVFGSNLIAMLFGGLFAAFLIRAANKTGKGRNIALWPSLIPAALAAIWYLYAALISSSTDVGREYMALPFYLIGWGVIIGVIAIIARRFSSN